MRSLTAIALLSYALSCATFVRCEPNSHEMHGWSRRSVENPDQPVQVFMALSLNQTQVGKEILAVSDPCSDRYGQYLSVNDVKKFMHVSADSQRKTEAWLKKEGLLRRANSGIYALSLPVSRSSYLFNTTYHEYEHPDGRRSIHAEDHRVPEELRGHVEVFGPGLRMSSKGSTQAHSLLRRRDDNPQGMDDCDRPVYPNCIRKTYGTYRYEVQNPDQNMIGIAGFARERPDENDLRVFAEEYRPEARDVNLTTQVVSRKSNQSFVGHASAAYGEGDLDMQVAVTQAWPIPVTYFYDGGAPPQHPSSLMQNEPNEPYLSLFQYLLDLPDSKLPSVLSISYSDPEDSVPKSYAERVCYFAALLGLRGVTVVTGSGDDGVGPDDGSKCRIKGQGSKKFVPWFPASCPYITTVGGTATPPNETVAVNENAGYTTGSGFSNYFSQPKWQKHVVQNYVNNSVSHDYLHLFQSKGRAYPDVAAHSAYLTMQHKHAPTQVSGTSAAAPIFASIVALLNDVRVSANQPRLGFLNPLLYGQLSKVDGAFHDITKGSNHGCGTQGFSATNGWDSPSGFGSPNFAALRDAVLKSRASCSV